MSAAAWQLRRKSGALLRLAAKGECGVLCTSCGGVVLAVSVCCQSRDSVCSALVVSGSTAVQHTASASSSLPAAHNNTKQAGICKFVHVTDTVAH